MPESKQKYQYISKRLYIPFLLFGVVLIAICYRTPHKLFVIPPVVVCYFLMLRQLKYAIFGETVIEVVYPLRKQNIILEYAEVSQAQYTGAGYKKSPMISVWTRKNGQSKKFRFEVYPEQADPILKRLKEKNPKLIIAAPDARYTD